MELDGFQQTGTLYIYIYWITHTYIYALQRVSLSLLQPTSPRRLISTCINDFITVPEIDVVPWIEPWCDQAVSTGRSPFPYPMLKVNHLTTIDTYTTHSQPTGRVQILKHHMQNVTTATGVFLFSLYNQRTKLIKV